MNIGIRKFTAMLLSFLLLVGLFMPGTALANDYGSHWAGETLNKWESLGLLKADASGSIQPNKVISRGEFVSLVNKMMKYTKMSDRINEFTDISETSPYYRDAAIALEAGYINGTSATTLSMDSPVTREQIVTIFCRISKVDVNKADIGRLKVAKDAAKVSEWARSFVAAAIENGYLAGVNGFINPIQNITLAESVVLLERIRTDTRVYSFPGIYGPSKTPLQVNNAIVMGDGITLKNIIVAKELTIENGVSGNVTLSNVTVKGSLFILASRLSEVSVQDGTITELNVIGTNVSLSLSGDASVSQLNVSGANARINLVAGCTIKQAKIEAAAKFSGDGNIQEAVVNSKGVDFSKKPTNITTKDGGSYTIDGTIPSSSGGSGSSDSSSGDDGGGSSSGGSSTVRVTGVSLNHDTLNLAAGGATGMLVATVTPANTTNKNVTWSSSAPAVATVANGVVTPVTSGSAIIIVTTADGSFTDTCAVTVTAATVPVTGVTLMPQTLNLTAGGATGALTATVAPANATNQTVTWSSSNPAVATVTNGVVTPLTTGNTTITVTTADDSFTDTCTVTVTAATVPVTGVTLTPKTLNLTAGGATGALTATVAPANATNMNATWSSSNPAVATVANGVVTPLTTGNTTITVTTVDGSFTDTCTVTVTASTVPVTSVTLTPDTLNLTAGGATGALTATVAPANATNQTVTWSSSNPAVATVTNGVVTPLTTGNTTITVTTVDGSFTDTCTVTVTAATVPVTGVTLTPKTLNLTAGGATGALTATVAPANATNMNATWSSSNPAVATVANGVVTPLTAGSTTITVTTADGSFTDTCAVTVSSSTVSVTGVTLTPETLNLTAGGANGTLTATVAPANATNMNTTWSSSNPGVATVTNGVVTPLTAGSTTITVTTADGSFTDTCVVTVTAATVSVTGVTLMPETLNLTAGGATGTLTATVTPANATNMNVAWSSSNPSVATVANGVVAPLTVGSTTITVTTVDGGFTDTCDVTVTAATVPVTGVTLIPETLNLTVGGAAGTLTATIAPVNATNMNVIWSSSNLAVATVANGVVTPLTAGNTTITVTTADGSFTDTCSVTVTATTVSVTGVTLTPETLNLTAGGANGTLTATVAPANATNMNVAWSSSNPSVATVTNGIVTPLTAGSTTITVTTADGSFTDTCTVTVTAATVSVTGVTLTPGTLNLTVGGATGALTATVAPANATNQTVTWSSSNPAVATVANGVVTPLTVGSTTIAVTTADGSFTDTCAVTVTATTVSVTGVTLTPETLNLTAGGATGTLTATVAPANATNMNATWSSSNLAVATVANGIVTPLTAGSTTITVTTADGSFTDTCSVTVASNIAATGVSLNIPGYTYINGSATKTLTLNATVEPAGANDTITWSTDNAAVATVTNGVVTFKDVAGTAKITATTHNGKTAECTLTAVAGISNVTFTVDSMDFKVGEKFRPPVTTNPEGLNHLLTWSSSAPAATVSTDGEIEAISAGTATITASYGGQSDTLTLTVRPVATAIAITPNTMGMVPGQTATFNVTMTPANAIGEYTLTSSDPSVAQITQEKSGAVYVPKIVARKPGTATITAKISGTVQATCVVTVSQPPATAGSPGFLFYDCMYQPNGKATLTLGIVPMTGSGFTHYRITYHKNYTAAMTPAQLFDPSNIYISDALPANAPSAVITDVTPGVAFISIAAFNDAGTLGVYDGEPAVGSINVGRVAALYRVRNAEFGMVPAQLALYSVPLNAFYMAFSDPLFGGLYFDPIPGAAGYLIVMECNGQWVKTVEYNPARHPGQTLATSGYTNTSPGFASPKVPCEDTWTTGNWRFTIIPYVDDPLSPGEIITGKPLPAEIALNALNPIGRATWPNE